MNSTIRYGTRMNNGVDRISSLPDDVLTHILSFVTTREAVQTCVLSKRWKNIWAFVPVLKISFRDFPFDLVSVEHEHLQKCMMDVMSKIEQFVKGVVQNREQLGVDRFQLSLDPGWCLPYTQRAFGDCIVHAMKFEPQICSLTVPSIEHLNLGTDSIFTCASLRHLELQLYATEGGESITPSSISLPSLESLTLGLVTIGDDFVKKLLAGCPLLKELVLSYCSMHITEIRSNKLKKLVLDCCSHVELDGSDKWLRLLILAPNLSSLSINSVFMGGILLPNMPYLADASLSCFDWYFDSESIIRGPKILNSLSNAASLSLTLNKRNVKVLEKDIPTCPLFNNLKDLKLGGWHIYNDFDLVVFFLWHSPNLQMLTLDHKNPQQEYEEEETDQEEQRNVLFQREYLEMVEILIDYQMDDELVDRLIARLLTCVKAIGKIVTKKFEFSVLFGEVFWLSC